MKNKINLFVIFRFILGGFFIFSGAEKLVGPYQNFLYVVQSYEIVGVPLEELVAQYFPWIEFFIGLFVFLGFWLKWALRGMFVLLSLFIFVIWQALLRDLPLTECGCLGEWISFPLPVTLILDISLAAFVWLLFKKIHKTSLLSLDSCWLE